MNSVTVHSTIGGNSAAVPIHVHTGPKSVAVGCNDSDLGEGNVGIGCSDLHITGTGNTLINCHNLSVETDGGVWINNILIPALALETVINDELEQMLAELEAN